MMVLPGLIDAHVHADRDSLAQAMAFGVTTVLDMGGSTTTQIDQLRQAAAEHTELADIRSAVTGLTPADGHPHQLIGDLGATTWPTAATAEQVAAFVDDRVAEGADYLKAWLEDGRVLECSVPSLEPALVRPWSRPGTPGGSGCSCTP
jgi:predicted amidohydrolase YtcJ